MRYLKAFLSHATPDKPAVRQVADALGRRGLLPWLDEDRLTVGTDMLEHLPEAISEQGIFVLFISPRIRDRPWVTQEIASALEEADKGRLLIIPVFMGSPSDLLEDHPLLKERWLLEDGRIRVLGGMLPEDLAKRRAADIDALADTIATAAYQFAGLREVEELAIYMDQRGRGDRFGEPANLPKSLPSDQLTCLVFRPDRRARTDKGTLNPSEWSGIRDTLERSISSALGDRQGHKVHLLGRCQYAYPFAMGRIFQRSTQTTLICYPARLGESFSNEGWGYISAPIGGKERQEETPHLQAPGPGERLPTVSLMIGQRKRLPAVAAYLKASPDATERGLFISCEHLGESAEVYSLVADVVATIEGLIERHGTHRVRIFTSLPIHSVPLLVASFDQLGVGIELMEWMAGPAPENVAARDLYAPFRV